MSVWQLESTELDSMETDILFISFIVVFLTTV